MQDEYLMKIESEFSNCVELIFNFTSRHSVTTFGGVPDIQSDFGQRLFMVAVHKGFHLAQEKIIDTLLWLEREISEIQERIKESRKQGKGNVKQLQHYKYKLGYYIKVTKKCADSIAWQMIGQQHYIARRLFIGEPNMPLQSTNLKMGIEFVKEYNNANPASFALLSDLTTFIQIGDALIVNGTTGTLKIVELKEGKVNKDILDFLKFYGKSKCDYALHSFIEDNGEKYLQQMNRIVRQCQRSQATTKILNTGQGVEPIDGMNVKISEDYYELEYFEDVVYNLLKQVNNKNWAIDIIEGCLFIGAYKGNFPGQQAFKMWTKLEGFSGPIIDFRSTFYAPIAVPPFLLPLGEKTIMDIIFGRKHLVLGLNFDPWLRLARLIGLQTNYYSRKQTAKMLNDKSQFKPYIHKDKAIKFSLNGKELAMGDGLVGRMLFDLVLPSSTHLLIKETLEIEWK